MASLFFGIKYLPIGIFQILYNTSPFWASLLGYVFLKERIRKIELFAMVFSFFLILIIALEDQKQKVGVTIDSHDFKNH